MIITYKILFLSVASTTIAPSPPTEFQCQDYSIPIKFKCDGVVQCIPDGSDETDCPKAIEETTTATPLTTSGKQEYRGSAILLESYYKYMQFLLIKNTYSYLPNKRGGPNKREG